MAAGDSLLLPAANPAVEVTVQDGTVLEMHVP